MASSTLHVVGLAQRVGDLVAGAARAADVEHDPQRVPARDARAADELVADDRDARRSSRAWPASRGGRRERLVQQRLAVHRELAARGVQRGHAAARTATSSARAASRAPTAPASMRPVRRDVQHRALGQRADDLVGAGEHRVGALAQRAGAAGRGGSRSAGPTTGRRRAARPPRGRPRRAPRRRRPCRSRSARRRTRRGASGARASAARSASGVTPWAMPSSSSYSGATNAGSPPQSTSPSTSEACELRCATTRAPSGASARHSAWLPWVAPLVRNHVRCAP